MKFIKFFQEISKADVALAGGKGASLGEMTQAGIPVPPGFVILANVFEQFLKESSLHAEIDSILHTVNHEEMHTVENASEKIKALILQADMPGDLQQTVLTAFRKLNTTYVAVRSSATAEDSASAAWAGQLDSYLNTTKENLLENVKKCWASLFTPRAIFYRFEKGLHKEKVSVAVVVQKMVASESSGIAFSVHPVTQDYNQLIIEAGFGLGEAIVSGQITPDRYVVEKSPLRILEQKVHEQQKGLFRAENGGNIWKPLGEQGKEQVLKEREILELSKLIIKIEQHYGFPVDVEWAREKAKFYITQSRPITTLDPKQERYVRTFKRFFIRTVSLAVLEYWHRGEYEKLKEYLQGATHFNPLFIRNKEGKVAVYYDINNDETALQPLIDFILRKPKEFFKLADAYENTHSEFLQEIKEPSLRNVKKVFELMVNLWGLTPVLVQIGELQDSALDKKITKRALELREKSHEKDTQVEKFFKTVITENYPEYSDYWDVLSVNETISNSFPSQGMLRKRQEGFIFFEQQLIVDKNREAFEMEFSIKIDDNLQIIGNKLEPIRAKITYQKHQRDYTLLGTSLVFQAYCNEKTQKYFKYRPNPSYVLIEKGILYHFTAKEDAQQRSVQWAKLYDAQALKKHKMAHDKILSDYRKFLKQEHKYLGIAFRKLHDYFAELLPLILVAIEIPEYAKNDVDKEVIDICMIIRKENEDVYKIGFDAQKELLQKLEKNEKIIAGSLSYLTAVEFESFITNRHLPNNLDKRKEFVLVKEHVSGIEVFYEKSKLKEFCLEEEHETREINEIKGTTAYKGKTQGRIKIIRLIEDAKGLQEGDVLVASMTDPRYVPIMKKAAAIITDEGGITCHAAIVSRELKKPCIIGTKIATKILKDGDLVEVDATHGIVKIIKTKSPIISADKKQLSQITLQPYTYYQRCFQWKGGGLPFLFSDIFMGHYKTLECLITLSHGIWTNFLPNKVVEQTLEDGKKLISNTQAFESYKTTFENYKKECSTFFEKIIKKHDVSQEELKKLLVYFSKLFYFYSKTEFFYVDKAFEHAKKHKETAQSLEKFDAIKNKGREYLNNLFLGEKSYFEELLRIIAEKFSVSTKDLKSYSGKGLLDLFADKKVSKEILEARRLAYIMLPRKGELCEIYGKEAEDMIDAFFQKAHDLQQHDLKGVIANKGKATGKVRIFSYGLEEFDKVQGMIQNMKKGEILVADTTSPELMMACKKAAAIVTNQGGLMSHAAIVSRELGIPCLVGLGNITDVVKNGDTVEVNANQGIVRILEKQEIFAIPSKEDYIITFWASGVSILYTDMVLDMYKPYDPLICIYEDKYFQYLTRESFELAGNAGINLYGNKGKSEKYLNDLHAISNNFKEYCSLHISRRRSITKSIVENFFKHAFKFHRAYSKTGFEHTDKAFTLAMRERNDLMIKNLNKIGEVKNDVRAVMNSIFFDKNSYFDILINHLSAEFALNNKTLLKYTQREILGLFNGVKVDQEEINRRDLSFVGLVKDGKVTYYSGTVAKTIYLSMMDTDTLHKDVLDGVIASKGDINGKIKGTVKVIPVDYSGNFASVNKAMREMKQGQILVTETTAPELMIACRKASAIITDQGGLMSHAAIVSRELKIPCIVGTKIATKILKDGDEVEVDANRGMIIVLKGSDNKKVMINLQSREHSLVYCYVWQKSNQEYSSNFFNSVKNILFINQGFGKTSVWYEKRELEDIFDESGRHATQDMKYFYYVKKEFFTHFDILIAYIEGKKKINNISDLKDYYTAYIKWWAPMAIMYVLPESKTASEEIQKKALKIRSETEKYSDENDRFFIESFNRLYPKYAYISKLMTPKEVFQCEEGLKGEQIEKIHLREKGYVLYNGSLYALKELKNILEKNNLILQNEEIPETDIIKGQIAFKGHVQGLTRVIHSKKQLIDFKDGEILVTEMTSPDYVPYMKRATAIVTDEGGVNCHAAIVSRELKIPCIVGTKVATQILNTGDLIEVDAIKGVVTILKK